MKNQKYELSLVEELPYWEFFENPKPHIVLTDSSLVSGFQLSMLDIECFDEAKMNQLVMRLRSSINSLSEDLSVQFYVQVNSDYKKQLQKHANLNKEDSLEVISKIAQQRQVILNDELENHNLYRSKLFIFIKTKSSQKIKSQFFRTKKYYQQLSHEHYLETLESLLQNLEVLKSSMQNCGLITQDLTPSDYSNVIYLFLNPKRSKTEICPKLISYQNIELDEKTLQDSPWLADSSPREQLVFGDLVLNYQNFILDQYDHRVLSLKTLPEITYPGQMEHFLKMPFHYDLMFTFNVPQQADEMRRLQTNRNMAHSLSITQSGKVSDLSSESKLSSTEELLRELMNTGQRIYAAEMLLVLREKYSPEGQKQLNKNVKEALSRFRNLHGAEAMEESVGAWRVLKNNLPLAPMELERSRKLKTSNLVDFLPIYGACEGDENPVVLFRNRQNALISFDSFSSDLTNYNSLVTGSSGSGKSFLNNCILLQELRQNMKLFIIDIGGSYRKITESLNGEYFEVNLSDDKIINPFNLSDPNQEPSSSKIKSLLAIIETMVSEDEKQKLPKLDRALLEKAIIELYKSRRAKSQIPTLTDLAKYLSAFEEDSMRAISKMLYLWTGERPYGKILDGQGCLKSDSPICTFDLKGLSNFPDLQSVMVLILTDFILSQVEQNPGQRKRIILDEAWQLLKSNSAANFMEYCARTLRKSGAGICFITQGIEEIISSAIGSAIINNTSTKFVLQQRGDSETLSNTLKLNSKEVSLIQSLEQKKGLYSEAFMIKGDRRQLIRIFPSSMEYWLSTSDAQDNHYLHQLRKNGLTLIQALEKAAQLFPVGYKNANEVI